MPVSTATEALADGFLAMFEPETAPGSTKEAAEQWAQAYTDYLEAGGLEVPESRTASFAKNLEAAFNPGLAGGGISLFFVALSNFFMIPLPSVYPIPPLQTDILVPELVVSPIATATILAFSPPTPFVSLGLSENATTQNQADALASRIASITLSSAVVQTVIPPSGATPPVVATVPLP